MVYMTFTSNMYTEETKIVIINGKQIISMGKGEEKSFKLLEINLNEILKMQNILTR